MSLTISTIINGTLTLLPSNNPVTILGTGGVQATATGADAIDGDSSTAWMISNAGTISSASGLGLYLNGPSSNLSNSGSISGVGGIFLNNDGSVTNTAGGTITATGGSASNLVTGTAQAEVDPTWRPFRPSMSPARPARAFRPLPSPTPASAPRAMATASDSARAAASTTPAR